MYKSNKLWTPLFFISRRVLPAARRFSLSSFQSPTQFSTPLSSRLQDCGFLSSSRCGFITNPDFSWKGFCSESTEIGDATRSCWNCGSSGTGTAPFLVCGSCRSIQPVDSSVDYFHMFGLEKKYDIEVGSLEFKYKDWQKKLHPDIVHTKSEREREYAAEQSARVNDAYRTLLKPLSRAIYILRLEGVDVNEEETVSDPELLMEIMEAREVVEEASDKHVLFTIQSQMQKKLEQLSNAFASAFQSRNFNEALNWIQRMTYYERVSEEIVKKL